MVEQKSTKKRSAPSQPGPAPKKVHLEKRVAGTANTRKLQQAPAGKHEKNPKRSRPITLPTKNDSATSSEDESEKDLNEELEMENAEEDEMDVDSGPAKDPNASREGHKAQRAVHAQRRAVKPHSTILLDAKRAWASARQKDLPRDERTKNVRALMDIVRGHVQDVVFKHDASRIIQTIVKHGSQKERDEVAGELKGRYKELAQNKYSKFLVTKLIRHCPAHRSSILLEFQGHVLRLLLHREASSVLADAFEMWANAYERTLLLRDFYGKETALFGVTGGSEMEKEKARAGLKGVLDGVEGERRRRVLAAVKENLISIFNNPEKGAITHAIVHRAMWEYLTEINGVEDENEREKLRREIFEGCQELVAEMVHTRDGSRVVREFIAQGSAKDRKQILKILKPHIARMCTDDEAQLVLFTALDIIDDTKLTAKSIITDITSHATTLCTSAQGRRALLYPLTPRSRRHFTPAQAATLAETDAIRAHTSKKESTLRAQEVLKAASEPLLDFVKLKGGEVARDPGGSLLIAEIMLSAEGDKSDAIEALLRSIASTYPSPDKSHLHALDLSHSARMYKTLLQGGHFSHTTKSVERSAAFSAPTFASAWLKIVGREVTVASCTVGTGSGVFVVAELCERIAEQGDEEERKTLREWFGADVKSQITKGEAKGKDVLLEKLVAL